MKKYKELIINAGIQDWAIKDLLILNQDKLMQLFLKLPCPSMQDMQGEFRGDILDTGRFWLIKDICVHWALNSNFNCGRWLGKGFAKDSDSEGHGYNSYLRFGKISHIYPMKTKIAKSIFDGKDQFELDYTVFNSGSGLINMVDEVRKINDNLYLGIGTWGYFKWQRRIPWFFALSGPRGRYAGVDEPHKESNRKFTR